MNSPRFVLNIVLIFLLFHSCSSSKTSASTITSSSVKPKFKHPEWIKNKTIYEVNLRQYSKEGTFSSFQKELPRLKEMGIDILWLMPIHPIGEVNRKGKMGSYYSVKDYKAVSSEFGTLNDLKKLVQAAHQQGMYVMLDWVANHTAWDHKWAVDNPEWFTKDKQGEFMPPSGTDWSDVIDLNYENKTMQKAMIEALVYWVKEVDIDGYRCDVASWIPLGFWQSARYELDKLKPVFMLAEAENLEYHEEAFDMSYAWRLNALFNAIASDEKTVVELDDYWEHEQKKGLEKRLRMVFTSNHDENTWHGSVYERLGKGVEAFAVLTTTMPGMPLVYSGQEAGLDKRLKFFEKSTIDWKESSMRSFYTKLLHLRKQNTALWIGKNMGTMLRLKTNHDDKVFAFARQHNEQTVVTVVNLSKEKCTVKLTCKGISGDYTNLFSDKKLTLDQSYSVQLDAWGYEVLFK